MGKRNRRKAGRSKRLWVQNRRECHYCGIPLTLTPGRLNRITADHKTPISKGGFDNLTNIVPACIKCNREKKDMTYREYLAYRKEISEPVEDRQHAGFWERTRRSG